MAVKLHCIQDAAKIATAQFGNVEQSIPIAFIVTFFATDSVDKYLFFQSDVPNCGGALFR
jgi:hypothetical protein